ncbi:semialdehyde dehydrogenase [Buttiauxella warmboldiae]|uniref:Semialdehyde dehydrogenase n=1 Tax=Buttiauxella warmboldiae TaxID=82993 RepID=A0A3N5DNS1_9ENTR|nr:phosphogluconate dehydrogenase C-terminal domain-containing protein [Buttiauxella warmboldiae]RPH29257.1 semialdehyde dehydrogenase [Buttiauxella warmboldiae]
MKITLFGAGGKMGQRLTRNLKKSNFNVDYVELNQKNRETLWSSFHVEATESAQNINESDFVILAVPDTLLAQIGNSLIPSFKPGATVFVLDPAVAYANKLQLRNDINIFISHPCHPPVINDEVDEKAKYDFFGGVYAKQPIVNCMYHGDDSIYPVAESIAKVMYGPVTRSHRVSVEHFALLEPGLVETISSTFLVSIKEAMDHLVAQGIDGKCIHDFLMGHLNIQIAVIFGYLDIQFSDAANKAVENARNKLLKESWMDILSKKEIEESVKQIIS